MIPIVMIFWIGSAVSCPTVKLPVLSAVGISKKLKIAVSTASESVTRGRQIVEEQGLKLLDEDIA